jgi:hypothetical protein
MPTEILSILRSHVPRACGVPMGKQTSFQTHCCREGPLKCRRNVGHTLISRVARSGLNTVFVLAMRQPDGLAENSRWQPRRYRITPDNDFLPDGVIENCVRHVITQIPSPCPAPTVTRGPRKPRPSACSPSMAPRTLGTKSGAQRHSWNALTTKSTDGWPRVRDCQNTREVR